ncbi:MAG: hypothetical protein ACI311_03900 [Bacilli bacterium]
MKNNSFRLILIFILLLCSGCSSRNYLLLLGEIPTFLKVELDNNNLDNINYLFTSSSMHSNYIYKMIENDTSIYYNDEKIEIKKTIKRSKNPVLLFFTYKELLPYIDFTNVNYVDEEGIKKQYELIDYNLTHIIYVLKEEYNKNIKVLGPLYSEEYERPEELLFKSYISNTYDSLLSDICNENDVSYISLINKSVNEVINMLKAYI